MCDSFIGRDHKVFLLGNIKLNLLIIVIGCHSSHPIILKKANVERMIKSYHD